MGVGVRPQKHHSRPEGQRSRSTVGNDKDTSPVTVEVMLIVRRVKVIEQSPRSKVEVRVKLQKLMPVCLAAVWDLKYFIYVTGNAKVTGRGQGRDLECDRDAASHVILEALNMRWNAKICRLLSFSTATFGNFKSLPFSRCLSYRVV